MSVGNVINVSRSLSWWGEWKVRGLEGEGGGDPPQNFAII